MKEETLNNLDRILNKFEEHTEDENLVVERKEVAISDFENKFRKFTETTIKPALKQIAEIIKKQGHHVDVKFTDSDDKIGCGIYVIPKGVEKRRDLNPNLVYTCNAKKEKVTVYRNTIVYGGVGGAEGDFSIEELTTEMIQARAVTFIGEVLNKSGWPPVEYR